jgi:hypothetical protein
MLLPQQPASSSVIITNFYRTHLITCSHLCLTTTTTDRCVLHLPAHQHKQGGTRVVVGWQGFGACLPRIPRIERRFEAGAEAK